MGRNIKKFSEIKNEFDKEYNNKDTFTAIVPVNLTLNKECSIKGKSGEKNEEYYKWQFIYSLINSGLYAKDFIGVEVCLPKGNKNSAPIKFDGAVFKSPNWFDHYKKFHDTNSQEELDWIRKDLMCVMEFKNENSKNIEVVFNQQLKPAIKEIECYYGIGMLYDTEKLYLFRKNYDKIVRFDETLNKKGEDSSTKELSLEIPDAYNKIPSYEQIEKKLEYVKVDRGNRTVYDLDIITGASTNQLKDSVSNILKVMDKQSMHNERGYEILIQILALKIFDEKRSQEQFVSEEENRKLDFYAEENETKKIDLLFYINDKESDFMSLSDSDIQEFIKRMRRLYNDAAEKYHYILKENDEETISWGKEEHIHLISEIVKQFQDYSFILSSQTDLYQLVFYQFANEFSKTQNGQFITPIPMIQFLVDIVNPKRTETVIDPTVGIADFLALAYKHAGMRLNDENLYGLDNDEQMIMLAQLNMLLNGDGNSKLRYKPDKGSITWKFDSRDDLIELNSELHKKGNWDNWGKQKKLKKFDIVLTNPPFGDGRRYEVHNEADKKAIENYELWDIARDSNSIDMGLIFLENAYRILKENGRLGIILSNSLASVEKWASAREWLMKKMRIVALFDLPSNVFADTGVNTTIIVAYKPSEERLEKLIENNYSVFVKDIKKVGYTVKTSNRVKYFEKQYKLNSDCTTIVDNEGNPVIDEEFNETVKEFKDWCLSQEKELQDIFL